MNKTKQIIAAFAAIAVIGAGGFWLYSSNDDNQTPVNTTQESNQQESNTEETANTTYVSYEGVSGKIALDLLKENYEVTTQDSDFGEFVTSINGTEADSNAEYWSFYVNGEYASEGAGTYQTTEGEKIEWKLEQLN